MDKENNHYDTDRGFQLPWLTAPPPPNDMTSLNSSLTNKNDTGNK